MFFSRLYISWIFGIPGVLVEFSCSLGIWLILCVYLALEFIVVFGIVLIKLIWLSLSNFGIFLYFLVFVILWVFMRFLGFSCNFLDLRIS